MNGDADVESRKGSFADIKEKLTVEMTGFYREGDFIAEHVVISILYKKIFRDYLEIRLLR